MFVKHNQMCISLAQDNLEIKCFSCFLQEHYCICDICLYLKTTERGIQIIFNGNRQLDSWYIPTVLEEIRKETSSFDELCHCISETHGVGSYFALWILNPLA